MSNQPNFGNLSWSNFTLC